MQMLRKVKHIQYPQVITMVVVLLKVLRVVVATTFKQKKITPTKEQQSVVPDAGNYGLSSVTVEAIPENYQDISAVTVEEGDVRANKVFIKADGSTTAGTLADNGAVAKTLDTTANNQSYTVPAGIHNGKGTVAITLEEKAVTPTKKAQDITPTVGKVLDKVTVAAIPADYQDVTGVTAVAADVLEGKKIVTADGTVVTGTMTDNGTITATIDGLTTTSYTIPAGKTSGGTVSLTNDIEMALAAI